MLKTTMPQFALSIFLLLITLVGVQAQSGDYLLTHHELNIEGLDNRNFEIKTNPNGQLCIANRSGILQYDGSNWDYVSTPSAALSLDYDNSNIVYVGCVGSFGKIDYKDNEIRYISLNFNKSDEGLYFKTIHKDSSVYFLSEDNIVRYHTTQGKSLLTFLADEEEYYTNMFEVDSSILVQTNKKTYKYANDSLLAIEDWTLPDNEEVLFFDKHPTDEKYVVGTVHNNIYIYKNNKFYLSKISNFLTNNHSFVTDGVWIDNDNYALSTLEDGILLYNNRKSKIISVINDNNGLPDNEIFAIGRDQENGFWISHEYGLSRLEINIPFRSFTNYQGIAGHIKDITWHNRHLYVATSQGVYYLDEQKNYKYKVYYVPKDNSKQSNSNTTASTPKRKRNSLFSKKKKNTPAKKNKLNLSFKKKQQYIRKVRKELVSSNFVFSKVEGLNTKSEKFLKFQNKMLIATSNGVYEIKEEKTKTGDIIQTAELAIHEPINFFLKAEGGSTLIVGTHYNEIKLYKLEKDIWEQVDELNFYGELILGAKEDKSGNVWFASPKYLHKFDSLTSEAEDHTKYEYHNEFIDDVKLTTINNQLYLINSKGYFYLDDATQTIEKDTALWNAIGKPVTHLQEQGGNVWINNGEHWFSINKDASVEKREKFDLFPEMSFITNYKSNVWLIDQSSELLKYFPDNQDSLISTNKMFIRKARSNKGDVQFSDIANFEHDENSFYFEMSRPDYQGLLKMEYQYQLKGQNDNWTEWSTNNRINLNYLIPNKYALTIKSRDSFGQIQQSQTLDFKINPPYWQTLWFYGLQILFMTALVYGSASMNRKADTKYVLVTEGLTILTIVMVIEFLQSAANSYLSIESTPVIDFGLNVAIALCVFPLEQFLKRYMKIQKEGPGLNGKGLLDLFKFSAD